MAKYNKEIVGNKNVEFIHVSFDNEKADALAWAKKEKFPWLHVMKKNMVKADLAKFLFELGPFRQCGAHLLLKAESDFWRLFDLK